MACGLLKISDISDTFSFISSKAFPNFAERFVLFSNSSPPSAKVLANFTADPFSKPKSSVASSFIASEKSLFPETTPAIISANLFACFNSSLVPLFLKSFKVDICLSKPSNLFAFLRDEPSSKFIFFPRLKS